MDRFTIIEKLIDWIEDATKDDKIIFGRRIYQKYAYQMQDKGNGCAINLTGIDTEFLIELYEETQKKTDKLEFWETLL
jgi:hypothetical protein